MIPASWIALRALIEHAVGPTCIVGGALRDLDNGKPVKDIDFFVTETGRFAPAADEFSDRFAEFDRYAAALRAGVPGLEVVVTIDPEYAEAFRDEVRYVWTCRVPGLDQEVQIILIDQPGSMMDIARRVDFGLCMIGYDGSELYRAPEYLEDQRKGVFTLHRADNETNHKRSLKRYERFREKYRNWPMVDRSPMAAFKLD